MPQSTAELPASEAGTCTAEGPETEADFMRMFEDKPGKALLYHRAHNYTVIQDLPADGYMQAPMRDAQTQDARRAALPLL